MNSKQIKIKKIKIVIILQYLNNSSINLLLLIPNELSCK